MVTRIMKNNHVKLSTRQRKYLRLIRNMIENLTDKQLDMERYMSDPTKEEEISVETVLGSKKTKCGTVGCIAL